MKNIPSFNEFKKYDSLLESVDSDLIRGFSELERADPYYTVNEGALMDRIKNSASKFFLGPLSRTGMIDDTRKILVDLEIDVIEQRANLENEIDDIQDQISLLSRSNDRQKMLALTKDRDSKIKELETYLKSQKLKIKKCLEHISKLVANSPRRKEYYEAGRAEDEIAIAEIEYQLAKERSSSSEIKKYEEKILKAKREAAEKIKELEDDIEDSAEEEKNIKPVERVDAQEEKKKISSKKSSDLIKRKNELAKEIIDIKSEMETVLKALEKKLSSKGKASVGFVNNTKIQLLELASTLDSKTNLLSAFKSLGSNPDEIKSKLSGSGFSNIIDMINYSVIDGQDANTGTKKIITSLFAKNLKDGTGEVEVDKLKNAIKKITK